MDSPVSIDSSTELVDGQFDLPAILENGRRLRLQPHELLYRLGSASLAHRLEGLAQEDEGDDDAGRLEIKFLDGAEIAACYPRHREKAVEDGRARPHGDEAVHVGRPVEKRARPHQVEPASGHDGWDDEGYLDEGEAQRIVHRMQGRGQGPAQHVAHRDIEEGKRKSRRDDEFCPHRPDLANLRGGVLVDFSRRDRLHREGFIARLLDRALYLRKAHGGGVVLNEGLLRGEIHRGDLDSRQLPDSALDGGRTGGAGHAADGDGDFPLLDTFNRLVTGFFHRGLDRFHRSRGFVETHFQGFRRQVDRSLGDTGYLAHGTLVRGDAGCAGHTLYFHGFRRDHDTYPPRPLWARITSSPLGEPSGIAFRHRFQAEPSSVA
jgi:hypothetical protein